MTARVACLVGLALSLCARAETAASGQTESTDPKAMMLELGEKLYQPDSDCEAVLRDVRTWHWRKLRALLGPNLVSAASDADAPLTQAALPPGAPPLPAAPDEIEAQERCWTPGSSAHARACTGVATCTDAVRAGTRALRLQLKFEAREVAQPRRG